MQSQIDDIYFLGCCNKLSMELPKQSYSSLLREEACLGWEGGGALRQIPDSTWRDSKKKADVFISCEETLLRTIVSWVLAAT